MKKKIYEMDIGTDTAEIAFHCIRKGIGRRWIQSNKHSTVF